MSLKDVQTRIITAPIGASASIAGLIIASFRTWQWQTQAPCSPVQLSSVNFAGGNDGAISQIDINGSVAYVSGGASGTGQGTSNLYIFNISNLNAPTLTSNTSFTIAGNPPTLFGFGYLGHIGTTVYLASNGAQGPGNIITVVNASTPSAPTLVSQNSLAEYNAAARPFIACANSLVYVTGLNAAGTHQQLTIYNGSLVAQGNLTNDNLGFVLLNWPTLYSAKGSTLLVVDVTTASAPVLKSTTTLPDILGSVLVPLAIDPAAPNVLYVLSRGTTSGGLFVNQSVYVYDVSDPTNPKLVLAIPVVDSFAQINGFQCFFVGGGTINITAGTGPLHLLVYTVTGSQIGNAVVNSGVANMSGAIVRAS